MLYSSLRASVFVCGHNDTADSLNPALPIINSNKEYTIIPTVQGP